MKKKQPAYWSEKSSTYSPYEFIRFINREGYCYLIYADAISEGDAFGKTIWALPTSDSKVLLKSIKCLIKTHHIVSVTDVKHQADKIGEMWSQIAVSKRRNTSPISKTLEERLIEAINNENYRAAAILRDKINSLNKAASEDQSLNNDNQNNSNA